jgi:uncharacterized protein (DUF2249 family)
MIELDVRAVPPAQRHQRIFDELEALAPGETLRLVNDHDPKPLRYQLEAERSGHFEWQVVASGPSRWDVDITSRVHVVDARPTLAAGGEPFDEIMRAAADVQPGEVLVVLAPFDPVPLHGVLGAQGFGFVSDPLPNGDVRTTFLRS